MQVFRNGGSNSTPEPKLEASQSTPLSTFIRKPVPEALPDVSFQNGDGQPISLASFRGRVVLLNLWATWCLPCRKEMPALDRLQAALGSPDFEVVALSVDRAGAAGARKFLDSVGVEKLTLYVDPTAKLANDLKAVGLPTTLLLDRAGREIGRLIGPAEWDDAASMALVKLAVDAK
jgi:thiol-disulfide isomerase/thioredoxin